MTSLAFDDVAKTFVMHLRGGLAMRVLSGVTFRVAAGECAVLAGPSGTGKSTVLKMAYGNYRADAGRILLTDGGETVDLVSAGPRAVLAARTRSSGYVSQFLSVIPRVPAETLVEEAARGAGREDPRSFARQTLARLNLPERLWGLPPATFSGGEQQRVNIAIGFAGRHRVLLLDEPTASLDAANRDVVIDMVREKLGEGCAVLAIFHDETVRGALMSRAIDVAAFAGASEDAA